MKAPLLLFLLSVTDFCVIYGSTKYTQALEAPFKTGLPLHAITRTKITFIFASVLFYLSLKTDTKRESNLRFEVSLNNLL